MGATARRERGWRGLRPGAEAPFIAGRASRGPPIHFCWWWPGLAPWLAAQRRRASERPPRVAFLYGSGVGALRRGEV